MEYTTNYNLAKPEATDQINPLSREAYNDNLDVIDEKIKEASENGGIAVQEDEPTSTVLAWIDTDEEGADFCYVGDTAPTNDGSVAVWVDTSDKAIKTLVGGEWNNVYDVATQSNDGLMSSEDKSKLDKMSNYSTNEQVIGTWIDGKPLYRKVIQETVTWEDTTGAIHQINFQTPNIKTIIKCDVFGGASYPMPYCTGGSLGTYISSVTTTYVAFWNKVSWTNYVFRIILEYTKTTD